MERKIFHVKRTPQRSMMDSVWSDTVAMPHFPQLREDLKIDVLIIGGGITGLLCAYQLMKAGISYTLVEADTICSGVTKNTTAKITSQHGLIYRKLIREFGADQALQYLRVNELAVREYEKMCQTINCDFEKKDSYVYSIRDRAKIEDEVKALHSMGFDAEFVQEVDIPLDILGAVKFKNQAQFHPLKFLAEIAKDLHIYEHTKVVEMGEGFAKTNHGMIMADRIVVATQFPINNKHGAYFLKMYQSRSYVLGLQLPSSRDCWDEDVSYQSMLNVHGMYVDEDDNGLSFRNYRNLLLLGGGGHRTGKYGGNWKVLSAFAKKYYPEAIERYAWATQDCMTLDSAPYVGMYGKYTEGFYVMTGFNKWGMTSAMASSIIVRDMLLNRENAFVKLYDPHRTMMRSQLIINAFEAVKSILTFSSKRCPHMGCTLKWNEVERSWDCPCHGSRFQENGELIDNPATDDLKD